MHLDITIKNYVNSVEVFLDGTQLEIKKLSFFSNAQYECELEKGVHEIHIIKHSKILDKNWKKEALFDWISCISGVADWTIEEKLLDKKQYAIRTKIKIEKNSHLGYEITSEGIFFDGENGSILENEQIISESIEAAKRIKLLYILPVLIICLLIEGCLLGGMLYFLWAKAYVVALIFLFLVVWWFKVTIKKR